MLVYPRSADDEGLCVCFLHFMCVGVCFYRFLFRIKCGECQSCFFNTMSRYISGSIKRFKNSINNFLDLKYF